ncbi:MAG: glutamine amidotransferase [Thermoleophilia bacterium]|nr:glutamine amidotransferase [Thermoleophilia bacterium]MDH3725097.1 glutamine amidotransferase [Thermoleophilia bacterium]
MKLRICHLYPRELNIYADRGNIAVFRRRSAWRGIDCEVSEAGLGDSIDPDAHDLFYLGGGQDRDQALVAPDLVATKGDALHRAAGSGAVVLAVCGGYQLAGHCYTASDGSTLAGIGLLDVDTVAGADRLIGDLALEVELDGESRRVVGYENHAGRTRLGPGARPLGRVIAGAGNDGESGFEGARRDRVVGTYLHGPLLPKNPWLADRLISWALRRRTGRDPELEPLLDDLEAKARQVAVGRAGRRSG